MRYPVILLAVAILLAPVIWHLTARMLPSRTTGGASEDRIAFLEAEIDVLNVRIEQLERAMRTSSAPQREPVPEMPLDTPSPFGGFDELTVLSARGEYNWGLRPLAISELEEIFGMPAPELSQKCAQPRSEKLMALLETRNVGPFEARLIRPALDSLERVLGEVKESYPELYRQLHSYGSFCARLIRGSKEGVSRHSFGIAIDISIGGTLDQMGDGMTQFGLIILQEFFHQEGWIWGASFGREDSMHFEVSAQLLSRWLEQGLI